MSRMRGGTPLLFGAVFCALVCLTMIGCDEGGESITLPPATIFEGEIIEQTSLPGIEELPQAPPMPTPKGYPLRPTPGPRTPVSYPSPDQ